MSKPARRLVLSVGALVAVSSLVGCARPRDLFATAAEGSFRELRFPAGFFGPGTEAFKGRVALVGSPLNPTKTGAADSILERSADPIRPHDPVGTCRTVRLKLVALSLMSKEPITVMSKDGPQQWQVHAGLSEKGAPTGSLTATKTHANGGTFDSTFYAQLFFTFINVKEPNKVLALDTAGVFEPLKLSGKGTPFVIKADPALSIVRTSRSNFVPAVSETRPGNVSSQILEAILHRGPGYAHLTLPPIVIDIPIPEPGDGGGGPIQ